MAGESGSAKALRANDAKNAKAQKKGGKAPNPFKKTAKKGGKKGKAGKKMDKKMDKKA
jgi:hypothetical protein